MSDKNTNERQEKFLSLFKYFDNTKKACEWIGKATLSSPSTVAVWRCSGPSAYGIPERPYKMLMDRIKRCGLPKSGR